MKTIMNGTTAYEMMTNYRRGDRSAIVLKRPSDGTYVVGKNYEMDGDERNVCWCWGCYDIPTVEQAQRIALAWCFD